MNPSPEALGKAAVQRRKTWGPIWLVKFKLWYQGWL